jgi:hypothetical protein
MKRSVVDKHLMLRTLALLLIAALATGCERQKDQTIFRLLFGETRFVPMTDDLAGDYIPQHWTVVPKTLQHCGAKFLGFDGGITDGGEAAYFTIDSDNRDAMKCIRRQLPQGRTEKVEKTPEIEKLLRLQHDR